MAAELAERESELRGDCRQCGLVTCALERLAAAAERPLGSLGISAQDLDPSSDPAAVVGECIALPELAEDRLRLVEGCKGVIEALGERLEPAQVDEHVRAAAALGRLRQSFHAAY